LIIIKPNYNQHYKREVTYNINIIYSPTVTK
jgi:hypothetical protein